MRVLEHALDYGTQWPAFFHPTSKPRSTALAKYAARVQVLGQGSQRSKGSMGVPVGALLTPLPVGAPPPVLLPRRPTSCDRCRAFVNLYCKVSLKTLIPRLHELQRPALDGPQPLHGTRGEVAPVAV